MIFVYKKWEEFCDKLAKSGKYSITAAEVADGNCEENYLVLKHDVETDVKKAFHIAEIEKKYGHRGVYYVQGYLLENKDNVSLLKQMQEMGHEISYHYDVLDFAKGDYDVALKEFNRYLKLFSDNGFVIRTLCQHGNPVVERIGYTSNRDFFRNPNIKKQFSNLTDIMVDFKETANTDYNYYSDAGRKFKKIFDPINNDRIDSEEKNISYKDLNTVFDDLEDSNSIVSTHPHRWCRSKLKYIFSMAVFKVIRAVAKLAMKIPGVKKVMSKYYYLAKKI